MKEKKNKKVVDKNYFDATSYELAGEIGILDNEEMKQNKKLNSNINNGKQEKPR